MAVMLAVATLLFSCCASAELQRLDHAVKADGSLSLLVIGDWGRRGGYNQSHVATQMGRIGEELHIDFVISTGDNFYESGLSGEDDKAFEESYVNVYTAKSLQKQWYSVLGNHDYRGNVIAQMSPVFHEIDSRWLCMRSFILDTAIAQFFFVDTTPFVMDYWTDPENHHYDWRDVAPREAYIANLLKDLDTALKESTATWKFVIGHHTMRSVSEHGDTVELLQELLPILKVDKSVVVILPVKGIMLIRHDTVSTRLHGHRTYFDAPQCILKCPVCVRHNASHILRRILTIAQANSVDLYINGHDHCLEHISSSDSPIQYLTSGGGSKAWRGVYTPNTDNLRFFYDGQGFMSMELTKRDVNVAFYDAFGRRLYEWSVTKELHPSM